MTDKKFDDGGYATGGTVWDTYFTAALGNCKLPPSPSTNIAQSGAYDQVAERCALLADAAMRERGKRITSRMATIRVPHFSQL